MAKRHIARTLIKVLGILFFIMVLLALSYFFVSSDKIIKYFSEDIAIKEIVRYFPFTKENSLREWEEKILKGKVIYRIEKSGGESYVKALSQSAASALYYKIKMDIKRKPMISWKWRIYEFPKRRLPETISGIKEEDFAARVYVIFPAAFFTKSKVIEYIWAEHLPVGTYGSSGYSRNIKVLVLESGDGKFGWKSEKRSIFDDYVFLFGKEPHLNVGAIAFMTDADSTKTRACATYDDIKLGYSKD